MERAMGRIIRAGAGLCLIAGIILMVTALPVDTFASRTNTTQQVFSSPEEARNSLVAAVQAKDHAALGTIFGPVAREMEPGDPVEQATEFEHFARHLQEGAELVKEGETKAILLIGTEKWPFPIQIVKKGDTWLFDTEAGREEILNRRIGRNELLAIKACRAYVEAQQEYYNMPEPDGVGEPTAEPSSG